MNNGFPEFVPDELARLNNWVFWQSELNAEGRPTKVPYQVRNWKRMAASTRPEEWASFHDAARNHEISGRTGVGFVFEDGLGIFGIDIDDLEKVAPEDREASLRLRGLIHEHFQTYCERSPSGTGWHYIGYGSLPAEIRSIKDSKYGIEVYDKERFFTFTGLCVDRETRSRLVPCQDALTELAHTMRGAAEAVRQEHDGVKDQRPADQIIAEIQGWKNGDEFTRLFHDPVATTLARYKQDHSAADFALLNFIASATKDSERAVEIFRRSPLWRGTKGGYNTEEKYISRYVLGWGCQKVWGENAVKEKHLADMIAEGEAIAAELKANMPQPTVAEEVDHVNTSPGVSTADPGTFARQFNLNLPMLDTSRIDVPMPPGMAGRFVQSVMEACYTPVPDFCVAVSMAYLSGLIGRAYRFQRKGTNCFFITAAKSATGKTQSIEALQHLLRGLENPMPADRLYSVSGKTTQGMQRYFEQSPAGGWITDECGAQVKALTEPNNQGDHELKDAINSLFDAAIPGKRWQPPASIRSQKEDKSITCLSVGIGWFTTREKVYSALNDDEVADGFLSRFIPIFYNGTMGADNPNVRENFPDDVAKTLSTLWSIVQENDVHMPIDGVANSSKSVTVTIAADAKRALDEFGEASRNITRRSQNEHDDMPESFIAMSRVGISAQRLAAVCAVLDNPIQPVITFEHVQWGVQLVGSRMLHVLELMATGEVGSGDRVEVPTVIRTMKRLIRKHGARVPMSTLHDTLRQLQPFKTSRIGPMNAVRQALNNLIDENRLARVVDEPEGQGRPTTYYMATKDKCWKNI